ncbi:MAG TPA: MoaD/ThiS family protein [Usitatibacteraceae bacterium]|nr:MoaD/ThiS family protein [Usitatibacteraceae bacterium]
MKVVLPSPLAQYTAGRRDVDAEGATVAEVLGDLDRRFPGIRFRMIDEQDAIRAHIKIFVNREIERSLAARLAPGDEILIVAALSGG